MSRARLIETARTSDCHVVAVTAPAGYGKSTLLAEWAVVEDRRVAYVSLDRFDDDPTILLTLLASAYAQISPDNADLVAEMSGLGVSALGRAAPRLASALRTSSVPFVVMLDDLHELQSPACQDVLSVVISGIPGGSQLVAASRSEQPYLPRLRAAGEALEFTGRDLTLDSVGAEQIFAAAHVSITPQRAAVVTERTEGWPAGLYLAAVIARDSNGEALTVSGEDRYVADYLYHESLMRLPENLQRFLRRTAVLDQMCAPLCDAVLEESGGQQRLRGLEALSLFVIPLDRRREWYRYHALFREFLLGELRGVEPEVIRTLHQRAADWYESNGSPATAIEHLLNTTEQDRCVQLVTQSILPTYQAGQLSTVQRWLSVLGDSAIEGYPPLAVLAGYISVFTGQTAEAQHWAAVVDAASFDLVPADGTASFDSARAMLRAVHMCRRSRADDDRRQHRRRPRAAVERLARHGALLSSPKRICSPETLTRASVLFAESSTLAAAMGNTDSFVDSESELALLATERGHGRMRPGTWNRHSPLSISIGCMTTSPARSPSPSRPGSLCTGAT